MQTIFCRLHKKLAEAIADSFIIVFLLAPNHQDPRSGWPIIIEDVRKWPIPSFLGNWTSIVHSRHQKTHIFAQELPSSARLTISHRGTFFQSTTICRFIKAPFHSGYTVFIHGNLKGWPLLHIFQYITLELSLSFPYVCSKRVFCCLQQVWFVVWQLQTHHHPSTAAVYWGNKITSLMCLTRKLHQIFYIGELSCLAMIDFLLYHLTFFHIWRA